MLSHYRSDVSAISVMKQWALSHADPQSHHLGATWHHRLCGPRAQPQGRVPWPPPHPKPWLLARKLSQRLPAGLFLLCPFSSEAALRGPGPHAPW